MNRTNKRNSSVELLRVIAMFFILICHAVLGTQQLPSGMEIRENLFYSLGSISISSIAITGVDVFVLISGWFGINFKLKSVLKIVFETLFLLILIYSCVLFLGIDTFSIDGVRLCLALTHQYWFIMAYIGLCIFAPILNAFVENCPREVFKRFLILFYVFQMYYCLLTDTVDYYGGYSIVFFCGLYLTARYFRVYTPQFMNKNAKQLLLGTFASIVAISTISLVYLGHPAKMFRYDNPLVIVLSLSLLYIFVNRTFNNSFINWLAGSCLSVYIIHYNPYVFRHFQLVIQNLMESDGMLYALKLAAFLSLVFLVCVLVDQIRIFVWTRIVAKLH